ncbi:MAG: PD-(D/E)XK nuclease family transposase [Proteobacteria bacterium]|nr:PD-(D/E)XK nuclease family transposase [Pseudomonadota bacterium]
MQNKSQKHFSDRALYYAARAIAAQGKKGEWDYSFDAVYGVYFLNFTQPELRDVFRSDFGIRRLGAGESKDLQMLSQKLRMVFLQMPLFQKKQEECKTRLDKWTYIWKNMESLKEIPWRNEEEAFNAIANAASLDTMSEEERNRYDDALRELQDAYSTHAYAREQGEEEGKRKVAQAMLKKGMDDALICELTQLSMEDIQKLREEHERIPMA